jgi:hypothetical protein
MPVPPPPIPTTATRHTFVQNLRRGHYELSVDMPVGDRVRMAFTDLALFF